MKMKLKILIIIASFVSFVHSQPNSEFRSTWVITWNHIDRYAPAHINKMNVQTIMDNHKRANMNAVLFQARQGGTAYYESSYEPWGYYAGYEHPGYDPLEYAIQEAHKRGMELHAWFNVFQCSSTYSGSPAAEHPEWICRDRDGFTMNSYRSLSPGLEDVRNYTVEVAMEIVNNYDIDGLHLDYIRWNEHTNSLRTNVTHEDELKRPDGYISNEELIALNSRSGRYLYDYLHPYSAGVPDGYSSWEEWWRWSVTEFVRTLHDSIQTIKPHVRLSVAALGKYNWSGWQGYGSVYQDGALWFNEGYIEQLMPMHYHWTSANSFYGMLEGDCPECWSQFIQPGIESGRLYTVGPGSYILEEYNSWNNHGPIVETCRTIPWVGGFQFFSYGTWHDNDYWLTAGETFFKEKTIIPNIPVNSGTQPNPPGLSLTYMDSVFHDLTIIPSNSSENYWNVLYQSTDGEIDPDRSKIIDVHFGCEPYTVNSGFINENDSILVYGAVSFDRYWNSSQVSPILFATRNPISTQSALGDPYPNPFHNKITIPFTLADIEKISIKVVDITGREIAVLTDKYFLPGTHSILWNGKAAAGGNISSGIYFIILKNRDDIITKKICLVK